jgi:hypothetical protein
LILLFFNLLFKAADHSGGKGSKGKDKVTLSLITASPSSYPTQNPTAGPSSYPTQNPTTSPSSYPTQNPTAAPSSYPTNNPTPRPSPEPTKEDVCPDNEAFSFGSFQYQGQTITRTCAWIVEAPQLEGWRRNRWCNERFRGDLVKDVCPTACDNCCKDNPRYKFGNYEELGEAITRTCAWITSVPQLITQRRNNWCNAYRNRARVEDECPVACNECDPIKKQVENCPNDPAYTFGTFEYEGNTITRTCAWIIRRPETAAQRKRNWCNRVHNGSLVKTKCRGACDNCCEDDVNYTFGTFPYNGGIVTRDCAWIIEASQLVERRRNRWCDKYANGAQVDSKCPVACGNC